MFFKRLFSRSNLELKINDGGRAAAGYKGQAGDCVVRSIAIATGMPYQKIYDDLFNTLTDMCKEWFGEYLFDIYRTTCEDNED